MSKIEFIVSGNISEFRQTLQDMCEQGWTVTHYSSSSASTGGSYVGMHTVYSAILEKED